MPNVKVRYLGAFADSVPSKEETCSFTARSLGALLDQLLERNGERFRSLMINPETGNLRSGTTLLVNGQRRDLDHELSDGDEITLLTPVAGGNTS